MMTIGSRAFLRLSAVPLPCVRYAIILAITIFQTLNVDNGAFVLTRVSQCSREAAVLQVRGRLGHSW
jgi:hypothetical protein